MFNLLKRCKKEMRIFLLISVIVSAMSWSQDKKDQKIMKTPRIQLEYFNKIFQSTTIIIFKSKSAHLLNGFYLRQTFSRIWRFFLLEIIPKTDTFQR